MSTQNKTRTLDEILTESSQLQAQVTALTGDKTKLVAGATLPTDLVTAANRISELESSQPRRAGLSAGASPTGAATPSKKSFTERVLEAKGVSSLEELRDKNANQKPN